MSTKKIWIRLGGYLTVDESQLPSLLSGDKNTLVEIIKKGGFKPVGESYIPTDAPENPNAYDIAFDLNGEE